MSVDNVFKKYYLTISIGIVWLFQISGIIGISLGYKDWFLSKTPGLLLLVFLLTIINFPINTKKTIFTAFLFFIIGMLVEWVGVHHDFLFGAYHYGNNLGLKLDGVPYLIGINWTVLTLITATIANKYFQNKWFKIVLASLLMIFLDFFMETSAPPFDFWIWENGNAPLQNYITWFLVALLLHFIYQRISIKPNASFAINVYLSQLVFFVYFFFYYHV